MSLLNNSMKSVTLMTALVMAAGLGACSDRAMPTGYTYHNEMYKTPPGPEASKPANVLANGNDVANAYATDGTLPPGWTQSDIDGLTIVAEDLLAKLVRNFGKPMEPTIVLSHESVNNRDAAMEIALRRAMTNQGIPIAPTLGDGPFRLGYAMTEGPATGGQYTVNAEIFLIVQGDEITRQHGSVTVSAQPMDMSGQPIPPSAAPAPVSSAPAGGEPVTLESGN